MTAWVIEGQVSDTPHAHPIHPEKGQKIAYVDTVAEGQVVVYVTIEAPPTGAWARFTGTELRFETTSPRPGSTKKFPVKQLTVEKIERLPGCDAVQALVEELGRDGVSQERKQEAQAEILRAGKDAFPLLIASLDDERVYEKDRDVQNDMGMSAIQKPPPPILADVKVGSVCRDLLYGLLVPVGYTSPHERVFKPRGQMLSVKDWSAWWLAHREESLETTHAGMRPLVDAYFKSGGDTQEVR